MVSTKLVRSMTRWIKHSLYRFFNDLIGRVVPVDVFAGGLASHASGPGGPGDGISV